MGRRTLMGAPHTTLTGTRWGPSHEKLGDVMPTCFRPHLNSPQQPCSDDFVDASSVIWCVCATMLCSAVMWWKSTFARQMQRLCGGMQGCSSAHGLTSGSGPSRCVLRQLARQTGRSRQSIRPGRGWPPSPTPVAQTPARHRRRHVRGLQPWLGQRS